MKTVRLQGMDYHVIPEEVAAERVKDPEVLEYPGEWITLSEEGFPNYVLLDDGRVMKVDSLGMCKKPVKMTPRGRSRARTVSLYGNRSPVGWLPKDALPVSGQFYVHRLLAKYFIEKPTGAKHVRFVDGDPYNLSLSNIAWK